MPVVQGCPLRSDPFDPVSPQARRLVLERGDDAPLEWVHRSDRYHEKLATPDVTIADIIGDVDPIKAAREKIDLSDEGALHFGIIPRSNRGLFVMNELPDLQPRIQVGLLNILEEKDVQVRGFPVRIPLDIVLSFTANPEDYTNRGNIITPLKDRIDSQILTHYPRTLDDAIRITRSEAWTERPVEIAVPHFVDEILEQIAFTARESDYVDQSSGVSQRLPIRAHELLHSAVERRIIRHPDEPPVPRLADLAAVVPAITGRIELVYEGEQEGPQIVAHKLVGRAMLKTFQRIFPPVYTSKGGKKSRRETFGFEEEMQPEARADVPSDYRQILSFFSGGGRVELSDDMDWKTYHATLGTVPGLGKLVDEHKAVITKGSPALAEKYYPATQALAMEWVLECLHQVSLIAKQTKDGTIRFADMLANMLGGGDDE
jgi:magnesium chelatase subunit I